MVDSFLLDESDLIRRVIEIKKLQQNCFKYFEASSQELLSHKIIFSIAKISSENMRPVKLSEISLDLFGISEKSKQDLIRLTIEKSLTKCGIVEKLRYNSNNIRYILTAYRFQKIRNIDSFRGDRVTSVESFDIPKSLWPIPDTFYHLLSQKFGIEESLKKLNADFDNGFILRGKYDNLNRKFSDDLINIQNTLSKKFSQLEELI